MTRPSERNALQTAGLLLLGLVLFVRVLEACDGSSEVRGSLETPRCFYRMRALQGHFSTPGFPNAFPVPFDCSWVIDASHYGYQDPVIVLYLTQMYLTRGVHIIEYSFFNETFTRGRRERKLKYLEKPVSMMKYRTKFLEVQVSLQDLIDANIRVHDRLIDVYGFNITYEIHAAQPRNRQDVCNAFNCSFNGHCFASKDYSQFQCSCLPGFHGRYCQNGPDCDPLRGINPCNNGGICRYTYGPKMVRCQCPLHYNGTTCEFRRDIIPASECWSLRRVNCSHHCTSSSSTGVVTCGCPPGFALRSDNSTCYKLISKRLLVFLDISSAIGRTIDRRSSAEILGAELSLLVRKVSAERLSMGPINFVSDSRIKFHLWSSEVLVNNWRPWKNVSSSRIPSPEDKQWPSAVNTTMNYFRRVSLSASSSNLIAKFISVENVSFEDIFTLEIEWIQTDAVDGRVREGYPFTVACRSTGSQKLQVRWFKDGIPVDPEKSLREMETGKIEPTLLGYYTSYLMIKKATALDRGDYSCLISDWDQEASKSLFIEVLTPPSLELRTKNTSAEKGSSMVLACVDDNDMARRTTTSYSWFRDGQRIYQSCDEIVETMYPVGSLLKVFALKHSTVYTCVACNEVGTTTINVTLTVMEEKSCPVDYLHGILWSAVTTDSTVTALCPSGYEGFAQRSCVKSAGNTAVWNPADFTRCIPSTIAFLKNNMNLISMGYSISSIEDIIDKFGVFLGQTGNIPDAGLIPGSEDSVVKFVFSLVQYLRQKPYVLSISFWNKTCIELVRNMDVLFSLASESTDQEVPALLLSTLQTLVDLISKHVNRDIRLDLTNFRFILRCAPHRDSDNSSRSCSAELQFKTTFCISMKDRERAVRMHRPPVFNLPSGMGDTFDVFFNSTLDTNANDNLTCAILLLNGSPQWLSNVCVSNFTERDQLACKCSELGTVAIVEYADKWRNRTADERMHFACAMIIVLSISLLAVSTLVCLLRMSKHHALHRWLHIQLNLSMTGFVTTFILPTESKVLLMCGAIYIYAATVILLELENTLGRRKLTCRCFVLGILFATMATHGIASLTNSLDRQNLRKLQVIILASYSPVLVLVIVFLLLMNTCKFSVPQGRNRGKNLRDATLKRFRHRCQQAFVQILVILLATAAGVLYGVRHGNPHSSVECIPAGLTLILAISQLGAHLLPLPIQNDRSMVVELEECQGLETDHVECNGVLMEQQSAPSSPVCLSTKPARVSRASLPLLLRAGLGPDIQRAFVELRQVEKESQALTCPKPVTGSGLPDAGETDSGIGASAETQSLEKKLFYVFRAICQNRVKLLWNGPYRSGLYPATEEQTVNVGGVQLSEDQESSVMQEELTSHEETPEDAAQRYHSSKPFKGRCLLRCSPDKQTSFTALKTPGNRIVPEVSSTDKCERCWQNPEMPACDGCLRSEAEESNMVYVRTIAVVEPSPMTSHDDEYVEMDVAGSLAVTNSTKDHFYTLVLDSEPTFERQQQESVPSTPRYFKAFHNRDRFANLRTVRKHRLRRARSWLHSTVSLTKYNRHSKLTEGNSRTCASLLNL